MHRLIAGVIVYSAVVIHFIIPRMSLTYAQNCCAILHNVCCSLLRAILRYGHLQINVSLHCRRNGRSLGNRYGRGSGPIWLDNLHCTGTESQLASCRHNGWGRNNCGHYEDVSIRCLDNPTTTTTSTSSTSTSTLSTTTTVPGTTAAPSKGYK